MFEENFSHPTIRVLKQASIAADTVKLSVVIPSFNTAPFVVSAIRSALEQTFSCLEVIVVDDGSTDESIEAITSISDTRLTCITQQNSGLSAARNTGIRAARGPYIGLLDSDDIWFPRKAELQIKRLESDPKIGLVFSYSAYITEAGLPTGQFLITNRQKPLPRDLVYRNHIGNGSTPIIRKDCFIRAGLFNEGLRSCEDVEMWVRIGAMSGYEIQLVAEPLTGYRVRRGSLSTNPKSMLPAISMAVECFKQTLPELSQQDLDRAFAQLVRIVSRKAFSNGEISLSRSLLISAWGRSWSLPLYDSKALFLLLLHAFGLIFPHQICVRAYDCIGLLRRRLFEHWGLKCPTRA